MGADSQSDNHPDHHNRATTDDTPILHAAPPAHPEVGDTHGNTPETGSPRPEWWYDQHPKRGKHRRYHGYVKRINGTAGDRIRKELAATIYDLLVWAKQQTDTESGEDGGADDHSE
jgi:hypothetical protein